MAKSKWMTELNKSEAAVKWDYDPFQHTLLTPSPSVNWIFGNTHGLPRGYSMTLSGPPKGGKSLLAAAFVGQLHKSDPEAIAVKFDTELRAEGQLTEKQFKVWGIDRDRFSVHATNKPDEVFDVIEGKINALVQEGAPIKLVIIDSINGIIGRRSMDNESVLDQQRGDQAQTIQEGLGRILTTIRRNKIGLILTAQIRAEQDANKAKYNPTRVAVTWAVKHFAEYVVSIEPNNSAEGKTNLAGEEFIDEEVSDMKGKGEKLGHKIRATMVDSSMGPKGRTGEFTLSYSDGVINVEEELYHLAVKRNIVERPNNTSYVLNDFPKGESQKYVGKVNFVEAIKNNEFLAAEILRRIKEIDLKAMRIPELIEG